MRIVVIILTSLVVLSFIENKRLDLNFQSATNIIGEWTPIHSVNKKYSAKNCLPKDLWKFIFMSDGTYKRVNSSSSSAYNIGKYKLDIKTKTLKLFSGKYMPGGGPTLDITYNIISMDSISLTLNECYCKESEADKEVTDKCITTYKRTK
jgi:hypothetical protein